MNIKIYVAHHKPGFVYKSEVYEPIQVGRSLSDIKLPMLGDDTGDNISHLNPWYCELTALYWVWRNVTGLDYVGFCHYRRYLTPKRVSLKEFLHRVRFKWLTAKGYVNKEVYKGIYNYQRVYSEQRIIKFLKHDESTIWKSLNGELFLPRPIDMNLSVMKQFEEMHGREPLLVMIDAIKKYDPVFCPYLIQSLESHQLFAFNMFVVPWYKFSEIMTKVFLILNYVKDQLDLSDHTNSRMLGFLSERLIGGYLSKGSGGAEIVKCDVLTIS